MGIETKARTGPEQGLKLNIFINPVDVGSFCFQLTTFDKFKIDGAKVCPCVCVCVCVCVTSDSSETIKVIIIKLGTVTASDMLMHHVLIILTLTVISHFNHEHKKCSIISETLQGIPCSSF